MNAARKIAVLACGVLEWNIDRIIDRLPNRQFVKIVLPARLHDNPQKLRQLLQREIDRLDGQPGIAGVVLGFGVCGRGTISLQARGQPLVIAKTQDCIGISLGSHERYMREFRKKPGTRYLTRGWYEKTVAAKETEDYRSARDQSLYGRLFSELAAQYGEENARFICEFRRSWQRNYQRAAYIRFAGEEDTPPGRLATSAAAQAMAWEDEELAGDESLLEAMLGGQWQDPRLLVVPPYGRTVAAPGGAVIGFATGTQSEMAEALAKYRRARPQAKVRRQGVGLGIDTGGTFTDAAVYNFDTGQVEASAKAPTVHENLIQGIREALSRLPSAVLPKVSRVGISTTLATNAFIEKKGRPVALLTMTPIAINPDDFPFRYVHRINGVMNMEGVEVQAVDEAQVREQSRQAQAAGCQAVAVSGFAGIVNPQHELAVAELVRRETGLHTVCGHELSGELNFVERATTAAMNARLVPLLEDLLASVDAALAEHGLKDLPVMVVKGDGSQMLDRVAKEYPVETLLSGPAASVVGAAKLLAVDTAVVVDMGGTTLDTAVLRGRQPARSERGARIGEFQTSVRAMQVHTIGLGGDSEIDFSQWPRVAIGPRRVVPVCRMARLYPATQKILHSLPERLLVREKNAFDFIGLRAATPDRDGRLIRHLRRSPILLSDLAERAGRPGPQFIPWEDLESSGVVQRYGLTLTDILQVQGVYQAGEESASRQILSCWAGLLEVEPNDLIEAVQHEFRRLACGEILRAALPPSSPWGESPELVEWLTGELAAGRDSGLAGFRVRLGCPLIAVGAPAPALFPQLQPILDQRVLIPEQAAVANAVGAIAGDVLLRQEATIRIAGDGVFVCSWRGGSERCGSLTRALECGEHNLRMLLQAEAEANRIPWREPVFAATEQQGESRDGPVLLGVTLEAELKG